MAGRKSLKDELKLFERYSDLTEPYFRVLRTKLNSVEDSDQKWAVEQLSKAFVKMLPQDIDVTSQGESISGLTAQEKEKLMTLINESERPSESH